MTRHFETCEDKGVSQMWTNILLSLFEASKLNRWDYDIQFRNRVHMDWSRTPIHFKNISTLAKQRSERIRKDFTRSRYPVMDLDFEKPFQFHCSRYVFGSNWFHEVLVSRFFCFTSKIHRGIYLKHVRYKKQKNQISFCSQKYTW